MGFQVTCAENGEEALQILESENGNKFDLIITDLTMPGISGEKLLRKINNIFPQIPIILSSGYSQSHDIDELKVLGVKEILMKPYSISELTKTIRQALEKF